MSLEKISLVHKDLNIVRALENNKTHTHMCACMCMQVHTKHYALHPAKWSV